MKPVRTPRWMLNVTLLIYLLSMPGTLLALPEGGIKQFLAGTDVPHDIKFSPDGSTLAVAGELGIVLYETKNYRPYAVLEGHKNNVAAIAFSPDSKMLASASWDATIKLWDVAMKSELHTFKGHKEAVNAVVFSPDGKVIASGSGDKTIKLWNVSERHEVDTFEDHKGPVTDLLFSTNGERLVSGSQDGTVKLWNVPGIHVTKTLEEHRNWVSAIALSPDGQTFVSGSLDKTVWVGEVPSGAEIARLRRGEHYATDITFSSDGRILAQAFTDHTVRLQFRTNLTADLKTLRGHSGSVTAIAFAPDPAQGILASVSEDQTVILWDLKHFGIEIRESPVDIATGGDTDTEIDGKEVSPVLLISGDPSFPKAGLKAGETAILTFVAQNKGDADADQVKIIFSSDAAANSLLSVTRPGVFKIPKNNQKLVEVPIHGDRALPDGTSEIKIQLHDTEYDVRSQIVNVPIRTVALPMEIPPEPGPPQLVLAQISFTDITPPNLLSDSSYRQAELKFYVENQGDRTAENAKVKVSEDHTGLNLRGSANEYRDLKSIDPAYNQEISYTYDVTSDFTETEFTFKIEAIVREGKGFNEARSFPTQQVLGPGLRNNSDNATDEPDNTQEVDVRTNIPSAKEPNRSDAFAYVVGINDYDDFSDLKHAEDDAEYVREYLVKTLGYKKEHILPRDKNENITFRRLRDMLSNSKFSRMVEKNPNAEVFIYFSGHGAPGTEEQGGSFLLPSDCDETQISDKTAYSLTQFEADLKRFHDDYKCKRLIVVLDACFSGHSKTGESLGTAKTPRMSKAEKAKNPLQGTNTIKMSSSSGNQPSYESAAKSHGFFTYYFLKGLQGEADQDKNNTITIAELKAYLNKEVADEVYIEKSRIQNPEIKTYNDDLRHHPIVKFAN